MKPLNRLEIDEEGIVAESLAKNRRLRDLGLVGGARIKCVLKSLLGDPAAYKIRGAIVAVRKEDSSAVLVEVPCRE